MEKSLPTGPHCRKTDFSQKQRIFSDNLWLHLTFKLFFTPDPTTNISSNPENSLAKKFIYFAPISPSQDVIIDNPVLI
jgi:hypothetical protein